MIRKIVKIDRENATAAACASMLCHEGALQLVDGKPSLCLNRTVTG